MKCVFLVWFWYIFCLFVSLVCFSSVFEMCFGPLLNYTNLVQKSSKSFDTLTRGNLRVNLGTAGLKENFLAIHLMCEEQIL